MPRRLLLAAVIGAVVLLPGCGGGSSGGHRSASQAATAPAAPPKLGVADLRRLGVQEGGLVPVLMYHRIVSPIPAGDGYARTPAQFRADLARLDREGYTSIPMADLVAGRVDVPAGRTPVVLTFDDSTDGQFNLLPDGSVDPDSAVGIMNAFAAAHPEFGRHAIFYCNATLFDQPGKAEQKLDQLIAWGYEIGNHTYSHANLSTTGAADVQAEIGRMAALLRKLEPAYTVQAFALPFGAMPSPPSLATSGGYRGVPYRYRSDVLVGAEPSPSPFARRFAPLAIPRIRAAGTPADEFQIGYWLDRLERDGTRFISDGDPATVTVTSDLVDRIRVRRGQTLRSYAP